MTFVNTRTIIAVIIILVLLIIIKGIISSIINLRENSHIVSTLNSSLNEEKKKDQFLKEELYFVQTPEYIEQQAREKLGLVKPGEHIVLAPEASSTPQTVTKIDNTPNWEKWWKVFF